MVGRKNKDYNAEFGAWLSIIVYIGFSVLKIIVGYISNSEALMADGLNNTTDIIASVAVLIGLRISKKPADADHTYGHSRAETVASMVASFIMVMVGLQVIFSSIQSFLNETIRAPSMLAAWVSISSAVGMFFVYRFNIRLSKKTGNLALKAMAFDNRSDALVSVGAAIGIFGSVWGLSWLDGATALIVGLIICKTGWDIFKQATHMLTDGFDADELEKYKETVTSIKGVKNVKDIKGRLHGDRIFVDLVIRVNKSMSVYDSHEISEKIETELQTKHHIEQTHVHIEPH